MVGSTTDVLLGDDDDGDDRDDDEKEKSGSNGDSDVLSCVAGVDRMVMEKFERMSWNSKHKQQFTRLASKHMR